MKLAGVGYSDLDILVSVEKMPKSGEHPHVLSVSWQGGGPVSTALATVGRLGGESAMFCTVGGSGGRFIRADLERHHVDCRGLVDVPGRESWMFLCMSDREKQGRSFIDLRTDRAVPRIAPAQIDLDLLEECDWLLICDTSPAAMDALELFSKAGKTVVIDADAVDGLRQILPGIHHAILSEDLYMREFGPDEHYERNLEQLHRLQPGGRAVTVVTLGEKGCAGLDETGSFFRLPACGIRAVDTTGAGDVFHGAYIAGRFGGLSAAEACRQASAVSALKCLKIGGRAGIPTQQQVREFMRTGRTEFEELEQREAFYHRMPLNGGFTGGQEE